MQRAFVYIVESPSPEDLLDGRAEGSLLKEALKLAGLPHFYSLVANLDILSETLGERLDSARILHQQRYPILHLSMHGAEDGICLTSGEFISWDDLRKLIIPLLRMMPQELLICMSSCSGLLGFKMAMKDDAEPCFGNLVGSYAQPLWSDAAIAYATFYHLLFKGHSLEHCVESMKIASGDDTFAHYSGIIAKIAAYSSPIA